MKDLPFDLYDFFGYIASGLLALVTMDIVLGFPAVIGQDFKAIETTALFLGAYVAGQLVAGPAKGLLECARLFLVPRTALSSVRGTDC